MSSNSASSVWENYKNTKSFLDGIVLKSQHIGIGDWEVIETTWTDSPVEVDVHRPEDNPDTLEIRPMFFGETLDLEAVTVAFEPAANKLKPT